MMTVFSERKIGSCFVVIFVCVWEVDGKQTIAISFYFSCPLDIVTVWKLLRKAIESSIMYQIILVNDLDYTWLNNAWWMSWTLIRFWMSACWIVFIVENFVADMLTELK